MKQSVEFSTALITVLIEHNLYCVLKFTERLKLEGVGNYTEFCMKIWRCSFLLSEYFYKTQIIIIV